MESTSTTECKKALAIIERGQPPELVENAFDWLSGYIDKTSNGGQLRVVARTLLSVARRKGD